MTERKKRGVRLVQSIYARILCFILFPALLAGAACKQKPPAPPPPPAVTVSQPVRQVVTDYLEITGSTQAIYTVQLVARVAGYLEKVFFQDGQMVKKGQPLFLIQQNTYQDALSQAEAQILLQKAILEYAERQYARYSSLFQEKAASQADVDNWRYQRDSALANLKAAVSARDIAKLNLDYTEVAAPFDGRIDRRLQDPGNLVGSGANTVLAELNQIDPIYVYFNISDSDLSRLMGEARWSPEKARNIQWPVFAGLLNEAGYPHRGRLDFASISLTPTTGTLLLRGTFPNPGGKILPGLYARVRVPLKEGPALLVTQEAIGYDQRGPYVLSVNEKNIVERVGVKTGALVEQKRVVSEGLTGKEWIVIKGSLKAIPGRPVTPDKGEFGVSGPVSYQPPGQAQGQPPVKSPARKAGP
jgi:RND family efflux transporter MFP subunit